MPPVPLMVNGPIPVMLLELPKASVPLPLTASPATRLTGTSISCVPLSTLIAATLPTLSKVSALAFAPVPLIV